MIPDKFVISGPHATSEGIRYKILIVTEGLGDTELATCRVVTHALTVAKAFRGVKKAWKDVPIVWKSTVLNHEQVLKPRGSEVLGVRG